jgi:hypothetical protein
MQGSIDSEMTDANCLAAEPLIAVRCPACGNDTSITGTQKYECRRCGQTLDPREHRIAILAEREAAMMRRINARQARAFLVALANIKGMPYGLVFLPASPEDLAFQYRESFSPAMDNYQEAKWLVNHKLFRQFFPPNFPDSWLARSCGGSEEQKQAASLAQIVTARNYLHLAWKATDSDERAWRIRALREFARQITIHPSASSTSLTASLQIGPPPKDAFQQALLYFQSHGSLARRCLNPDCRQTPYFFAEKPNQKYCNERCSEVARNAAKKLWWKRHGTAWRKSRSKASARMKPHGKR